MTSLMMRFNEFDMWKDCLQHLKINKPILLNLLGSRSGSHLGARVAVVEVLLLGPGRQEWVMPRHLRALAAGDLKGDGGARDVVRHSEARLQQRQVDGVREAQLDLAC